MLESWRADMLRPVSSGGLGLAEKTVEKHVNLLAAILKKAVQNGYLHQSPMEHVKRKKAKALHVPQPLTYLQVEQIADKMPERMRILVWIQFYTGMRPSEALGLTYDRLDLDGLIRRIRIDRQLDRDPKRIFAPRLKTAASYRTIALHPRLLPLIHEHIDRYGTGPAGLIVSNRSGEACRYKSAATAWREAATQVGLPERTGLHVLRHTFVSLAIQAGANPKEIQSWVGHESITETMDTYGHLFASDLRESMFDVPAVRQPRIPAIGA